MIIEDFKLSDFENCPVESLDALLSEYGWEVQYTNNAFFVWTNREQKMSIISSIGNTTGIEFATIFSGKIIRCSWIAGYVAKD